MKWFQWKTRGEEEGMNRKGCVPSWLLEPALQSRGSRHLTPAAPRPRHCRLGRGVGEKKGQGRGGVGRGKGKICATEVQGERDGIPRLLCTAIAAARLGNSGCGKTTDSRGDGGRGRGTGIPAGPAPGSPRRSSIPEAESAPLLLART